MTPGDTDGVTQRRYGAYVLPGDPTWLERTLPRYYPLLDDLVVPVPADGRGWTGAPIRVQECLDIVRRVDLRGLLREVRGSWTDPGDPLAADTAQRQAAIDALTDVDWILQLDNDELLPSTDALVRALDLAEARGFSTVEMPMRVLFRRTKHAVLEVVSRDGGPVYEYPGPVAVRAGARLVESRRTGGPFLRLVVTGDSGSLQVRRNPEHGEVRVTAIAPEEAILHNSWARTPRAIRTKIGSWGHANDAAYGGYYWTVWWPAPVTWRLLRDFHPFSRGLWPRLARTTDA
jgi:hypothetical protein